jgi:hypothetical protein
LLLLLALHGRQALHLTNKALKVWVWRKQVALQLPCRCNNPYSNPAGMTQLKGTNLSGNATFIYAPADIENAQGSQAGTNNGDMIPPTWVGSGFMTHQMNDN